MKFWAGEHYMLRWGQGQAGRRVRGQAASMRPTGVEVGKHGGHVAHNPQALCPLCGERGHADARGIMWEKPPSGCPRTRQERQRMWAGARRAWQSWQARMPGKGRRRRKHALTALRRGPWDDMPEAAQVAWLVGIVPMQPGSPPLDITTEAAGGLRQELQQHMRASMEAMEDVWAAAELAWECRQQEHRE